MTLHTVHGSATSTGRGTRTLRGLLAAAAATSLLGLAACGDDSTVDNSQSEVTVPSVSESAEPSESATDQESEGADSSEENAPAPNNPAPAPQDSGAEEVESIPATPGRSAEDDDYLNQLREGGIDLAKVDGANAPGGMEDQLIAAARGFCQTEAAGSPDVFTALAAGQLKTQGVVDREPQDIQPIIVDAARSAYCG